jgi:hypothetical protein
MILFLLPLAHFCTVENRLMYLLSLPFNISVPKNIITICYSVMSFGRIVTPTVQTHWHETLLYHVGLLFRHAI